MSERYANSEAMLERALKSIPLGTQTFSKSKTQYPFGVSPYYMERGQGSHVWDIDGNEYIDFINGLDCITLGYNDPDVNAAVMAQLQKGQIFSLPHPIEVEVSEKIIKMVPGAEMVRFGKNGSDATAGAIRLARAYTGRDHVAVCGYHGWQDWYIGSTARNMGVPQATQDLTHHFDYNDPASLQDVFKKYPDKVAAVIMEPMSIEEPVPGFLQEVQAITHKNGAVFIFDETITGFRFANGGAQEYFGVVPDLATFGKGISNGFPLSAVTGKAEIMKLMEEIFFSFTFGGETLSLAASLATLNKLEREPVTATLQQQGRKVMQGVQVLIDKYGLGDSLSISGHPSWSFLAFKDSSNASQWEIKTLFMQEVLARGILTLGTHNMSYCHSDEDVNTLLTCYDEVFPIIKAGLDNNCVERYLRCKALEPLFKLR